MVGYNKISKVYSTYYPSLILFALKWVKEEEIAKDLVQSVFINLLEKPGQEEILNYRAYLYKSVKNQCINYLKKSSGKADELEDSVIKSYGYFNDPMEEAEFESYVFSLINKLPPATQNIFKLNRFEGLSNQEIADKLKISKRTVELQISNALKVLRQKIFDSENPQSDFNQFLLLLL
ncbi:MAG: RNA polymerase sigma-70 factor [Bacteroidales bacterium]|nr:RNA polymerase sigma-70 factor [Bacteroidales bacterium]